MERDVQTFAWQSPTPMLTLRGFTCYPVGFVSLFRGCDLQTVQAASDSLVVFLYIGDGLRLYYVPVIRTR